MKFLLGLAIVGFIFALFVGMFLFGGLILLWLLTWAGVAHVAYWPCVAAVVTVWFLGSIWNSGR